MSITVSMVSMVRMITSMAEKLRNKIAPLSSLQFILSLQIKSNLH